MSESERHAPPALDLEPQHEGAQIESVARVVVDTDYLTGLLPDRPGDGAPLSAEGWRQALLYAGLLPLLRADLPPGDLAERLSALQTALAKLEGAERSVAGLRAPAGPDLAIAGVIAVGLVALIAGWPWVTGFALIAALGLVAARQSGVWTPSPEPPAEAVAGRRDMTRAVRAFLRHTWVEAVGDGLLESAPAATVLRRRMAHLDQTMRRARVRLEELDHLEADVRAANAALGDRAEDAETRRIGAQRAALASQLDRAEALRERFAVQLEACEAALDRLRALARRRLLSHRVAAAVEGEGAEAGLAEAEVDITDLDARADALGREVADAELKLSATLETAAAVG